MGEDRTRCGIGLYARDREVVGYVHLHWTVI